LLLAAPACFTRDAQHTEPVRIVAFGDVHGDLGATLRALRLAGAVDESGHWIGGALMVVQTGDQVDRGDQDRAILELFERLALEARAAGGAFHSILGNHELMNVASDLRYVTPGGFADFEDAVSIDLEDPTLAAHEPHQRARVAAFRPGGPYALLLAGHDVILVLRGNVFVHGGVLPHHVEQGLDRINGETRAWLRGEGERPEILVNGDSPVWTRLYSLDPDGDACDTLREVLSRLGAERMIVGHTVQEGGIRSACDGRVWCIDVGISRHYGGPIEVLQIEGGRVSVLREPGGASAERGLRTPR